jgi:hypothetical protein
MARKSWGRLFAAATTVLAVGGSGVALISPAAQAETITAATTCTISGFGSSAGPSSFTFTVPKLIHVGSKVPIQLSTTVTNNYGITVTSLSNIDMAGAKPVALTSSKTYGPIDNGTSVTVTLSGTWTPKATGTQTITAAGWAFTAVALGTTLNAACTFNNTVPSITRTVIPPETLALSAHAVRPASTVKISGAYWAPSSSGAVSLCANATGTAKCHVIGKVKTNASGTLTGTATIPAGTAAGTHGITVTVGTDAKATPVYILGKRALSLSATKVKAGHSVTAHGTGWNPGAKVKIEYLNKAHHQIGSAVAAIPNADGNFTVRLTPKSTSIVYILAAEASDAKLSAPLVKITVTS